MKNFFYTIYMGLFSYIKSAKENIWGTIKSFFISTDNFDELLEKLEDMLYLGDVGVETTDKLISILKNYIKNNSNITNNDVYNKLVEEINNIVNIKTEDKNFDKNDLTVIITIGINGVGKTTSIAKIANKYKKDKYNIVIGAGDTFRAAAVDQLEIWCKKINIPMIKCDINSHPSTVVFKTLEYAKENNCNIAIIDTAGRLHNKQNLMLELEKMNKSISKFIDNPKNIECWLVLDGSMGQNVFKQVKEFTKIAKITGFIITKADSIAKVGFIIGLIDIYKIPIKFVGVGEKIDDLKKFDSKAFTDELFKE